MRAWCGVILILCLVVVLVRFSYSSVVLSSDDAALCMRCILLVRSCGRHLVRLLVL